METKFILNINIMTLILIGVVIFLVGFGGLRIFNNKVDKLEAKIESEVKLRNSLTDSIHEYKNKEGLWVAEKLTMQASLKTLEGITDNLTNNQRELLKRIKEIDKKNDIITAALILTQVKIDSLLLDGSTVVDDINNVIKFSGLYNNDSKVFKYGFTVSNVKPVLLGVKPTLLVDSIMFPNKQFVEFHWKDNKKEGYPVTFTVSNSNKLFETVNIDSYAIPNLNKDDIDPSFGKKISNYLHDSGKNLMWGGVGVAVGVTTIILLTK